MTYEFRIAMDNEDEEEIEVSDFEDGTIRLAVSDMYSNSSAYLSTEEAEQLIAALYTAVELAKESKQ